MALNKIFGFSVLNSRYGFHVERFVDTIITIILSQGLYGNNIICNGYV